MRTVAGVGGTEKKRWSVKYFYSKILFAAGCLLLVGLCGCQEFRELFSPGHRRRVERREKRREALMLKDRKERPDDFNDRDPLRDMFKIKKEPYMKDKNLSDQERMLLKQEMRSSDADIMMQEIRSDYKKSQKKRHDWVFSK